MGGVGWVGLTVIIMQVSVQIGLNWYWTGTELGNNQKRYITKKHISPWIPEKVIYLTLNNMGGGLGA